MKNSDIPTRANPFHPSCFINSNEKEMLLQCLESQQWSSFLGASAGWDIKEVGKMSSRKAHEYGSLDIRYLGGKYVRQLEHLFAEKMGVDYGVSANSATSALVMALGALNLEPGDEVIVPCMSFNATATSILFFNGIPVFVEVKEDTFCLDPEDVALKITERTKAILVVHLGGNTADMDAIMRIARKHHLKVIEDCAQAPGVTYKGKQVGSIGDVGVFSLTETKNITCGEGGVLVTNDSEIAFKSRLIRNHGEGVTEDSWTDEELVNVIGMNFRLTELQAAVAIPQFLDLDYRNQVRRENTAYLIERLRKYPFLIPQGVEQGAEYICYILKWKYIPDSGMLDKDALVKALAAEGIPLLTGFPRLMHENPLFSRKIAYGSKGYPFTKEVKYGTGACPRSEEINKQFVWFKFINPPNTQEDMEDVVRAFEKVLK